MPPEVSERIFTQVLVFHETYQAVGVWLMEHLEPIGKDLPLLDWLGFLQILVSVRHNEPDKTQTLGWYLYPSSVVMRLDAISHIREISGPMNLKVRLSVF